MQPQETDTPSGGPEWEVDPCQELQGRQEQASGGRRDIWGWLQRAWGCGLRGGGLGLDADLQERSLLGRDSSPWRDGLSGRTEGGGSFRGEASGLRAPYMEDLKREDATCRCQLCRWSKGTLPEPVPSSGGKWPSEGPGPSSWGSWHWLQLPTPPSLPAVLVPGKDLANVLRTLPMFHDKEHAQACGLPENMLVLP